MKKLISILLIVVLIVSCMTFVGCEADVSLDEELFLTVMVRSSSEGIKYYKVSSKEECVIECHSSSFVTVHSVDVPRFKDKTIVKSVARENIIKKLDFYEFGEHIGEYEISEIWETGHEFKVRLIVWDEKPKYEIEYEAGDNCILQEENRYVCKYDGGSNLPSVKLSYKGEEICSATPIQIYRISEVKKYNGEKFVPIEQGMIVSDVGMYEYTFHLEELLPSNYKDFFSLVKAKLIIEIVE